MLRALRPTREPPTKVKHETTVTRCKQPWPEKIWRKGGTCTFIGVKRKPIEKLEEGAAKT